jgi:hypothetical protein
LSRPAPSAIVHYTKCGKKRKGLAFFFTKDNPIYPKDNRDYPLCILKYPLRKSIYAKDILFP